MSATRVFSIGISRERMLADGRVTCQKVMVSPRCVKKAAVARDARPGAPPEDGARPPLPTAGRPENTPDLRINPARLRHPTRAQGRPAAGSELAGKLLIGSRQKRRQPCGVNYFRTRRASTTSSLRTR